MVIRKRQIGVLLVAVLLFTAALCAIANPSKEKEVELRLANENATISAINQGCLKFAELLDQKTGGKLKVKVYPAGQLGGGAELFQAVSMGTLEMDASGISGQLAQIVPEFNVLDVPGIIESTEQYRKVLDSPLVQEWRQQLIEKANIRILSVKLLGTAAITCNKPIYKPSDLDGLKMRAVPFPIYMEMARALGGTPTPVAFSELFGALQARIVDGQNNDISAIYEEKFYEVQKYIMLTRHGMAHTYLLINEDVFQSLPPDQKRAVESAALEASIYETALTLDNERVALQKMKDAGNILIGPEQGLQRDAFMANVVEAMRNWHEFPPGLYDKVLAVAQQYR